MLRVVKTAVLSGIVLVPLIAAASPLAAGVRAAPRTVTGVPAPPMLTDFVAAAGQAYWRNDAGEHLAFPGLERDARGFALVRSARLEDGNEYPRILQTHPRWADRGRIEGSYHITLGANQRFRAKVGFITGAQGTDGVRCRVIWHSGGVGHTVAEITKSYEGRLADVSADLAPYGGQQGDLILWVYAGNSSAKDWIVWVEPRLESATTGPAVAAQQPALRGRPVADSDRDGIPDSVEAELVRRFSPFIKTSTESGGRSEDRYPPVDAVWALRHGNLKGEADEGSRTIIEREVLAASPAAILTADAPGIGSSDIRRNPRKTRYAFNLFNEFRDGREPGDGLTWADIVSRGNVGIYGHVVPYGDYYKIEYYQYLGYSDTLQGAAGNWGDHESEWEIPLNLIYSPRTDELVRVCHYAHGKEMAFDLRLKTGEQRLDLDGDGDAEVLEVTGPNLDRNFEIGGPSQAPATEQDDWKPWKGVNNLVRFYRDPDTSRYTHPLVYMEYGCHGMWPSEHWSYYGAPKHNGRSHSYLTRNILNLGEVEYPTAGDAEIILRYNGRWGAYAGIESGPPPPGPALHWEWSWPVASALRWQMRASGREGDFENGASIGHYWPAVVETLATIPFAHWDGLACADLDGDGRAEIVHADRARDTFYAYDQVGRLASEFRVNFAQGDAVAAGDVDGDGKDEVVHGDRGDKIVCYRRDGTKLSEFGVDFQEWDWIACGDVNRDRKAEIVLADRDNQVLVFSPSGARLGSFRLDFEQGDAIAAGDIDGNGEDEVVHMDADGQIAAYRSSGARLGRFAADIQSWDGLAVADLDGDGQDEIVHADRSENRTIAYDSAGREKVRFFTPFAGGEKIAAAQLWGDGRSEIVHADYNNFLRVFSLPPKAFTGGR